MMRKLAVFLMVLAGTPAVRAADEPSRPSRPREELREKLKSLPPAERRQRHEELRKEQQARREKWLAMSGEEREAKRRELRTRFQSQRERLRAKKEQGGATLEEERRLEQFDKLAKRFGISK